jgi:hypothetical protein
MSKMATPTAHVKRRQVSYVDRMRRNGGSLVLRRAALSAAQDAERDGNHAMAAALAGLIIETQPLFVARHERRHRRKQAAPVVAKTIIRRPTPRARRTARRSLAARSSASADGDGGGGDGPGPDLVDAADALTEFPIGALWWGPTIPIGSVLVRDGRGYWRILDYPSDFDVATAFRTVGRA